MLILFIENVGGIQQSSMIYILVQRIDVLILNHLSSNPNLLFDYSYVGHHYMGSRQSLCVNDISMQIYSMIDFVDSSHDRCRTRFQLVTHDKCPILMCMQCHDLSYCVSTTYSQSTLEEEQSMQIQETPMSILKESKVGHNK